MFLNQIKAAMNMAAALSAFIAAALWWYASIVVVRPKNDADRDVLQSAQITVEHESTGPFDPFLTGIKQSRLNSWAAIAAGVSALPQVLGLLTLGS